MLKTYQIVGIPLVDVRASFKSPSRFSDTVTVESEITEWGRSSFCVRHRLFNKNVLAVECLETRVWAALSATDPERIESKPVPQEVIERFSGENKTARALKIRDERSDENANTGGDRGRRTCGTCLVAVFCIAKALIRSWLRLEVGNTVSSACGPGSWSMAPSSC